MPEYREQQSRVPALGHFEFLEPWIKTDSKQSETSAKVHMFGIFRTRRN